MIYKTNHKDVLVKILLNDIIPDRGTLELIDGYNSLTISDIEPLNDKQKEYVLDKVSLDIEDIENLNSKLDLETKITELKIN